MRTTTSSCRGAVLKYLIGGLWTYGGRVSDNMDRRVLVTYLSEYMGDFLIDTCQKFYFSQAGFAMICRSRPLENYQKHIEKLPLTNSPAVFGLHPNAEIGFWPECDEEHVGQSY